MKENTIDIMSFDFNTLTSDKNFLGYTNRNPSLTSNNLHINSLIQSINDLSINPFQPTQYIQSNLQEYTFTPVEPTKMEDDFPLPPLPEIFHSEKEERIKKQKEEEERKRLEEEKRRKEQEELELKRKLLEEQRKANLANDNNNNQQINQALSYKDKLLLGAENFSKIKSKIKAINDSDKFKKPQERVLLKLNPFLSQLIEDKALTNITLSIRKIISDVKDEKDKELYILIIDQFLTLIFKRVKELRALQGEKHNFFLYSKLLSDIDSTTAIYLFFQRVAYYCPYLIPYNPLEEEFDNEKNYFERKGRIKDESILEFNSRMESFEYLYFTFLYINYNSYKDVVMEYLEEMDKLDMARVDFSIGVCFKVFMEVFGKKMKDENMLNKMHKIAMSLGKELEKRNLSNKDVDIKSINGMTVHLYNSYYGKIIKNEPTDIFANKSAI